MDIIAFLQEHPYETSLALLGIYEVFARYIPTEGNWTLVHNFARVLDFIVKNRTPQPNTYLQTTTEIVKVESEETKIL